MSFNIHPSTTMVKNPFNGNLNPNEVFGAIYNMIISQQVFADNLKGGYGELVNMFKVDGTLFGDTKLFYAVDVLSSQAWTGDGEAANLLSLHRNDDPKCQAITIDQYRMIPLTVDNYLTKRAWADEGTFASFQSVILGMMGETKKVYEQTLINSYIGTVTTAAKRNTVEINLASASAGDPLYNVTGLEKQRLTAMYIAQGLADLFTDLRNFSRDFNDYKFLRSYDESDFVVVWNAKYVNEIRKVDTPTIFHKEGVEDKLSKYILPKEYFGIVLTSTNIGSYSAATPTTGKPIDSDDGAYTPGVAHANGTVCSLVEKTVTVSGTSYHVFPGQELPSGATVGASKQFALGEAYIVDEDVICKVVHKDAIKYMASFEVGTSFFNPRSLTETHYLVWGYSTPEYLRNYPIISVVKD